MSANDNPASAYWSLRIDEDRVAWLALDVPNSSANSLSRPAMLGLDERLKEIERERPRAVIVQSAKKSGFIAGADIREFLTLTSTDIAYELVRTAQKVLDRLESLSCPTVAAIDGFALGGGLELALACRYIVITSNPKTSLGFPEVMLGIHPGFGGTVRSIRRIGPLAAMDMMLTGKSIRPEQALALGLVDAVVAPGELTNKAKSLALQLPPVRSAGLLSRLANLPGIRTLVAGQMRKQVAKRARPAHYPAPYALIELWRVHGAQGQNAFDAEARSIAQLFGTPTSKNLVRVFLLQDRLKGLGSQSRSNIERVHVVGAGVMGGDIAAWCAVRGLHASLQDRAIEYVTPAMERARALFAKRVRDDVERAKVGARLVPDVAGEHVAAADVVIEAIYEDANAKQTLYEKVEPQLKPGAVLGTNTSSIMLETLGEKLADAGRLVGIHFFNPVPQMQLVEVVSTQVTRLEVQQTAMAFVRRIDKLPLPCKSAPGFVVNRVLFPYLIEAMLAAEEGIPMEVIDKVALDFGMPMGPIELADVVGLDVAMHVGQILAKAFNKPAPQSVQKLVGEKKLGRKTGQGFYTWQDGKPLKSVVAKDKPPPKDLEDRLVLAMVNEAVAVLREQVVADADLLDAGIIFGTGFAPFRGGPVHYARSRGLANCSQRLSELAGRYGPRFQPDSGWASLS